MEITCIHIIYNLDLKSTITELLQTHEYVHVIALDFSKAFDSVRHYSLVNKLANFTIPDYLHKQQQVT